MYIQRFVKGIVGPSVGGPTWPEAWSMLSHTGIISNWWRSTGSSAVDLPAIQKELTPSNLDRHLHDYALYGPTTPFISLASGCVERDKFVAHNRQYSAIDTALDFATSAFSHEGYLFFGWVAVGLNPAVKLAFVAESVRDLNIYRGWSPYQLEGEITAKVSVPANQIEYVHLWDPKKSTVKPFREYRSRSTYVAPDPILTFRELF